MENIRKEVSTINENGLVTGNVIRQWKLACYQ